MRLICNYLHIKNCARKLVVCYGAAGSVGVAGLLFTAVQFCSIKKNKPKVPEPALAPTKLSADALK